MTNRSGGAFALANNLKVAHKGIILIAVPLITGLVAVAILLSVLDRADRELRREARLREIFSICSEYNDVWVTASVDVGIYAFTKEQKYKDHYYQSIQEARNYLKRLKDLLQNSAEEQEALLRVEHKVDEVVQATKSLVPDVEIKRAKRQPTFERITQVHDIKKVTRESSQEFENLRRTINDVEGRQIVDPVAAREQVRSFVIYFAIAIVCICAYLAVFFSRSITNRLLVIKNNALKLAARTPLHPKQLGKDEIAQLDHLFHRMASELKESAVKSRAITDNAVDIICAIDSSKRFVEINPACRKAWGFEPEEVIGKRFVDIIVEDDAARSLEELENAMNLGERASFKIKVRTSVGEVAHMLWSVNWSPEKKSYFCIAHDVTEQHRVEQLKKDFVSMVSHDLRTPLTSLQGTLALFEHGTYGSLNEKGVKIVTRSIDNLSRLINLIDSLLDLEKMEAGKMHMTKEVLDVSNVVSRSVDAVAHVAEKNGIAIKKDTQSIEGFGDSAKLIQVIVNLLSNAIKFSPKGSTIEVSYLDTDENFEVRVKDQGRGIPASHLTRVFTRFEQVESGDQTKKGGKGLGLAICKSIIEGHGGKIGVESQEGVGSTFWFRIPHPQ